MGMFDLVWVPCPECGTKNDFQSKGGVCHLNEYQFDDDIPLPVLGDVNRHAPVECRECGTNYKIEVDYDLDVTGVDGNG